LIWIARCAATRVAGQRSGGDPTVIATLRAQRPATFLLENSGFHGNILLAHRIIELGQITKGEFFMKQPMRFVLPLLILTHVASGAIASHAAGLKRYDITKMTCDQTRAALQSSGGAILRWRSTNIKGLLRYGTYIDSDRSCSARQFKVRTTIKTSDGPCRVAMCNQNTRPPRPAM
jgi:hypothetical protein